MNATGAMGHAPLMPVYRTVTAQAMGLGLLLLAGLWAAPSWLWGGPRSLNIALEFIAALLALVVSIGAIVLYIALGQRLVLFFGLSFFGAGVADLINAALSLNTLSSGSGDDPTTWTAGRLIHGMLLLASLMAGRWIPHSNRVSLELVGSLIVTILITSFTISLLSSYSRTLLQPDIGGIRLTLEWFLVLLFFWSAWGYLQLYQHQHAVFFDWTAAAAVIFGVAQIYAALFSNWRESHVNIPHALKVFGYIAALTGLYMENLSLFQETRRQRDALDMQNRDLERTNRELARLLLVTREIAQIREVDQLPQKVLDRAATLIPQAETGFLLLYDTHQNRMTLSATHGLDPKTLADLKIQPGESIPGGVFSTGNAYMSSSQETIERQWKKFDPENEAILTRVFSDREPIRQTICAPLVEHGEILGVMMLNDHTGDEPLTSQQLSFFQTLCNQVAGILRNVQLYGQIQAYARQLQTKNQELESFVYTASHDLRSPLVSLHGLMAMFVKSMSDRLDERAQRYLNRLEANVSQMEELIDGLLELSRVGRADIRKETLDMDGLVRQVAEQLRPQLENKRINLDIRPLPVVVAPALPMKQIFGNLLSNAIKYMGDSPERRIEVGGDRDEKEIRLYVRDTGIGIDPAYHDRIFIIFQRLKELEDVKGTGVGLAIVKKIVENLNGTISVESEKGKGATFTVTFPVLTAS